MKNHNQKIKYSNSVRMRKVFSFIFIILLCVTLSTSFTSCYGDNELSMIRKELKASSWIYKDSDWGYTTIYSFENDGRYTDLFYVGSNTSNTLTGEGTYVVEEDRIVMTNGDGKSFLIEYSFEDGNLELSYKNIKLIKSN